METLRPVKNHRVHGDSHPALVATHLRLGPADLSSGGAASSAQSSWIGGRRGHGVLGQDRCAGQRFEQSSMPSNVSAQIDRDRLLQTVVRSG